MTCPVCGNSSSVMYTLSDCETVVRKRKCNGCGHIFYTSETEQKDSCFYFYELQREKSERARKEDKEGENGKKENQT